MKIHGHSPLLKTVMENFVILLSVAGILMVGLIGIIVRNYEYETWAPAYLFLSFTFCCYISFISRRFKSTKRIIKVSFFVLAILPFLAMTYFYMNLQIDVDRCLDNGGVWDEKNLLCIGMKKVKFSDQYETWGADLLARTVIDLQKNAFKLNKKYSPSLNEIGFSSPTNPILYLNKASLPEVYNKNLQVKDLPFVNDDKYQILIVLKLRDGRGMIWKVNEKEEIIKIL